MTDRIVIEITGDLPDEGKFAILADAERLASDMVHTFEDKYSSMHLAISVRAVRPSKKTATPAAVVQRRAAE